MILSDIEGYVRQDLFDPAGGSQRWATTDIDRAIDKAVDRYSQYYPNIYYADMASQPFQRTYPYPIPANASYPVWWIERIIYPLQVWGSSFATPTSAPTAALAAGGSVDAGLHQYAITYLSQAGETPPSPTASATTAGGNLKVNLTNIPIGPSQPSTPGVATNTIIGRNIYRTMVGGTILYLVATLQDNVATTYTDVAADATLTGQPIAPTLNTSGVMYWPPIERQFNEHSNIFDSTAALAAGGNMGAGGSVGVVAGQQTPSFTLQLNAADLPKDNTYILRMFYATKQQLDANGSTIPEVHRDIIVLGACAYCLEAYQTPTNDNFDFQDGGLRDRIDDTKIPVAWRLTAQNKMQQFLARLQEIKQDRDFSASARVKWGEQPRYWTRL